MVALVLNAIGWAIKQSAIDNKHIPLILTLLGGICYPVLMASWTGQNIVFGIIIGAGSVGFHQGVTQYLPGQSNVPPTAPPTDITTKPTS